MVVFYVGWLTLKLHQILQLVFLPSSLTGAKSKAAKSLDAGKPKQVVEAVKQKQNVSAKPAAKSAAKATARQKTTTPPPSESDSQKHHQSKSEDRVAEAKKLDPADEINWKEEPFLTIVTNLAGTYRVNK